MSVHVRPQARFAAALVAAGLVSAASVTAAPPPSAPTISPDVANASTITDALYSLGKGVGVASSLIGIHVDATISVPFEATLALMAAQRHPELAPNVLSYLVQRFVNPAVGPPITAYPWLTEQTAALLASVLPYPLGPSITDPGLINEARLAFAAAFNSVLGQLPDPLPGFEAVQDVMNDTALGGAVVAGQLAVRAPLYMAWSTVNYLGNLPVNVAATLESAFETPVHLPGLVSNLIYGLLSPDAQVGLFGQLLDNALDPFTWLPTPIGYSSDAAVGLANQIRNVVAVAMNAFLPLLPTPVTPSALPAATVGPGQPTYSVDAGKGSTTPDSTPDSTLAAVTLVPAKAAEKLRGTGNLPIDAPTTPAIDAVAPVTPATTSTGVDVTALHTAADDDATRHDADAQASESDGAGSADEAERGHEKFGDAKLRPGTVKSGDGDTDKDRVPRPSTHGSGNSVSDGARDSSGDAA